ncbi:AraC family transcriptional regulator [Rhizobium sp. PP-F2F-G48]|nr:AraC family transcriptional regulator [Rhizobium sp. PP-F2F-G48]
MAEALEFHPIAYRRSRCSSVVHNRAEWGAVRADIVRRTGLGRQENEIASVGHAFLLNIEGKACTGEDFINGRRVDFAPREPGSVIFLPAGSEWKGWDEGDATGAYLHVSIKADFARFAALPVTANALKPVVGLRDELIEQALQRIAAELELQDVFSPVMVEGQAAQLIAQMMRRCGVGLDRAKGGLRAFDLKRVTAFMEARFSNPPTLAEIANEIGLSRRHFLRAFKQATGQTAFEFIARLRIQRAVDLLRTTELPATAIAADCGFASPSHFTVAFKKAVGVGPMEFRRIWRS